MGAVALRLHRSCDSESLANAQKQQKATGSKETEGWEQLHDQLSRRWELLGVCCSKIGDRKVGQTLNLPSDTVFKPLAFYRGLTKLSSNVLARIPFRVPL